MFLIEDRIDLLEPPNNDPAATAISRVCVNIKINNVDQNAIQGFKKPMLIPNKLEVCKLYQFLYKCIDKTATNVLEDYGDEFSSPNTAQHPFEVQLLPSNSTEPIPIILLRPDDATTIKFNEGDTVLVNINKPDLKRHKKLNTLSVREEDKFDDNNLSIYECLDNLFTPEKLDKEN